MNNIYWEQQLLELEAKGLRRHLRTAKGPAGREMVIDGRRVVNFCSNNYLGLAHDHRLVEAARQSLAADGFGTGASRLVSGNANEFQRLETELADFKGTEAALFFTSGYMANVGVIAGLYGPRDFIFSDKLNHASLLDGILLSRAELKRYPHGDMEALAAMLAQAPVAARKLIVTDSVFSMEGDIAPLDTIVDLANRYEADVLVDEAHALGVLGKKGRGAVEHFGLEGKIAIQMGTLSKAAGAFGAYVCGSRPLIDCLINNARSFIYTTGLPPSVVAAARAGLKIIQEEPLLRTKLWENVVAVRQDIQSLGFDLLNTQTPIMPILLKDPAVTVEFSRRLLERGIFVQAIRPPTVPVNSARLRITVMATHTAQDQERLVASLQEVGRALCLI